MAPTTAEEKATGAGPVNLTTTVLQSVIIEHLRSQLREPGKWLPDLLELAQGNPKLNEANITEALKKIDVAWPQFTEQTQAHTLFSVVDRVNVFPDKLGIKFNLPAVLKLIQ